MIVLVANRGEVACRIFTTLRELGVRGVAVYGPDEAQAPHVFLADTAVALPQNSSYLDGACLIAAAQQSGATAVHPGYGFLSQSAAFVEACEAAGLTFIGPSAASMRALGDKRAARALAERCGVPVVPGASACADVEALRAQMARLGLPLLLKAAGGGGGKGMRRLLAEADLEEAFAAAQREARRAFADDRLLVEKFLSPARHIEVQIVGDGQRVLALGDRECSLQRRYQKGVEEAPAACLTPTTRAQLHAAAVALGEAAGYRSLGTVEFLLTAPTTFYFLEVNPRLQVEHPVSELTLGIDLVATQLLLAAGGALPSLPTARGHAIEARLVAEDPGHDFLPSSGQALVVHFPHWPGIRVDSGLQAGQEVGVDFDGLLAKLIAHAPTREGARRKLRAALAEVHLLGLATNQGYLLDLLASDAFVQGETFTTTLEGWRWTPPPPHATLQAAAADLSARSSAAAPAAGGALVDGGDPYSPWRTSRGEEA